MTKILTIPKFLSHYSQIMPLFLELPIIPREAQNYATSSLARSRFVQAAAFGTYVAVVEVLNLINCW